MTEELNGGCLDEREAFEAWVLTQPGGTEYTIRRRDMAGSERLGSYVEQAVDFAWKALCALSTSKQAGSEPVAKWIDDPHDIEQGMMLNPAWLKLHGLTAQEAIATPPAVMPAAPSDAVPSMANVSWDWLRGVINGIPSPHPPIGFTREVPLQMVLSWIDEAERRAALSQTTQPQAERGYLGSTVDGGIDDHDEDRPHEDNPGAAQDAGPDAGAIGSTRGLGADQHHQHRAGQADDKRACSKCDCRSAGLSSQGEIREVAIAASQVIEAWASSPLRSNDGMLFERIEDLRAALAAPGAAAREQEAESVALLREAADYFAELYAKYQTKIGPFASKGQAINARIGAYLRATPPAAIPAAPSGLTDAQIIEWAIEEQFLLFCDEEDVVQIVRSAFQKWPTLAALTQPTTVQQAETANTERLAFLQQHRVALIPEYEGPWDAEVYGESEAPIARGSGNTPHAAIDDVRAALKTAQPTAQPGDKEAA